MDDRQVTIIAQAILKSPWIGPADTQEHVDDKVKHMLDLVLHKIPAWASEAPKTMSAQMLGRYVNRMNKAVRADDHGGIWELYRELDESEQWDYVFGSVDRWRVQEWKSALYAAAKTMNETPDPLWIDPL